MSWRTKNNPNQPSTYGQHYQKQSRKAPNGRRKGSGSAQQIQERSVDSMKAPGKQTSYKVSNAIYPENSKVIQAKNATEAKQKAIASEKELPTSFTKKQLMKHLKAEKVKSQTEAAPGNDLYYCPDCGHVSEGKAGRIRCSKCGSLNLERQIADGRLIKADADEFAPGNKHLIHDAPGTKTKPSKAEVLQEMRRREIAEGKPSTQAERYNGWTNHDTWNTMLLLENTQESDRWLGNWSKNFNRKIKAGAFKPEEAEKVVDKYLVPAARGSKSLKWAVGPDFVADPDIDLKKVNKAEIVRHIIEHDD